MLLIIIIILLFFLLLLFYYYYFIIIIIIIIADTQLQEDINDSVYKFCGEESFNKLLNNSNKVNIN